MSLATEYSPEELYEFEIGNLIQKISDITYDNLLNLSSAIRLYNTIKPMLDPMQDDAWNIVLDLMAQEEAECRSA